MKKLGLIAGGGALPLEIARRCAEVGRPLFVVSLKSIADPALRSYPGAEVGLGELGKCIAALRRSGCEAVCLAGIVVRPDFTALSPDLRGLKVLPAAIAAARSGDDALLRLLVGEFEKEGFYVEGADEAASGLTLPRGLLGRCEPKPEDLSDMDLALAAARDIGRSDIGQAAVARRGEVLACEAADGTDAMLGRLSNDGGRAGVLAKAVKPIQDTRVDLPTIGPATVRAAARASLAGIVGEAGRMLVLERAAVAALADELGLFVLGVEPPSS